jgi:hypothetical protein
MATQQRKYREVLGKIRICRPLDKRARAQAMAGILRTEGILAKLVAQVFVDG